MVKREPDVIAAVVAAVWVILLRRERVPQHTSILTGHLYYNEMIEHNNVAYFRKLLGWKKNPSSYFGNCSKEEKVWGAHLKFALGRKWWFLFIFWSGILIGKEQEGFDWDFIIFAIDILEDKRWLEWRVGVGLLGRRWHVIFEIWYR